MAYDFKKGHIRCLACGIHTGRVAVPSKITKKWVGTLISKRCPIKTFRLSLPRAKMAPERSILLTYQIN